jgi:hypothetical protein
MPLLQDLRQHLLLPDQRRLPIQCCERSQGSSHLLRAPLV